jgi:hypothetical protein
LFYYRNFPKLKPKTLLHQALCRFRYKNWRSFEYEVFCHGRWWRIREPSLLHVKVLSAKYRFKFAACMLSTNMMTIYDWNIICRVKSNQIINQYSCRTVSLWLYISISDYNAMYRKVAIYGTDFSAHFGHVRVYLFFQHCSSKYFFFHFLNLDIR